MVLARFKTSFGMNIAIEDSVHANRRVADRTNAAVFRSTRRINECWGKIAFDDAASIRF
jgi:hypothetical protein